MVVQLDEQLQQPTRLLFMTPERSTASVSVSSWRQCLHSERKPAVAAEPLRPAQGARSGHGLARELAADLGVAQCEACTTVSESLVLLGDAQSIARIQATGPEHSQPLGRILTYYPHRITTAAIESINSIIQTARRRVRGFTSTTSKQSASGWLMTSISNPFSVYPPNVRTARNSF